MANYGWQVEGPLIPCRSTFRLEGDGGSAWDPRALPLAAVPKAGWGGRSPAGRILGHFNKEPVNGRGAVA